MRFAFSRRKLQNNVPLAISLWMKGRLEIKAVIFTGLLGWMAVAPGCFCAVDKGGARGGVTTP